MRRAASATLNLNSVYCRYCDSGITRIGGIDAAAWDVLGAFRRNRSVSADGVLRRRGTVATQCFNRPNWRSFQLCRSRPGLTHGRRSIHAN